MVRSHRLKYVVDAVVYAARRDIMRAYINNMETSKEEDSN